MDNNELKKIIYLRCCELVDEKIATLNNVIEEAQSSAVSEGKSTAGDKYDTARAMSHITRDMYARQLEESLKLRKILSQIDPNKNSETVQSGSLVTTTSVTYFIAVSLGIIDVDTKKVAVISPVSPLGNQLLDKKPGDNFVFNQQEITIESIL